MPDWLNRILAVVLLVLFVPVILIIALAVLIGSGRPVFFRQTRVGRNGKDFTLLKFRTMSVMKGTENGSFDAGSSQRVT
ncbi:MAG TPA: sugar transferase, partial [Verrucomicrobiales bacterium]|nr:sugar transferase [Verrucomicrobiales bacterium]